MSESESSENTKIVFKKKKVVANLRKCLSEESEDEQETQVNTKLLDETKIIQKLRQRTNGVNIVGLALGRKLTSEDEDETSDDLFKIKSGGMINMKSIKSGKIKKVDDAYDTGIGTQFSAETNKRDEDEEMMKYIEEKLSKKKGISRERKEEEEEEKCDSSNSLRDKKYCSPEEAALQAVPDHLRISSTQRSEEMLSNQMLSGIPEVDLGIDAKIRNIEATEEAKLKLLWSKHNKKEGPSQFVPSNITVNFAQQNRFNIDDLEPLKNGPKTAKKKDVVQIGEEKSSQKRKENEKATDDYHYERFKKQLRRY